jgi:hypothetical protein
MRNFFTLLTLLLVMTGFITAQNNAKPLKEKKLAFLGTNEQSVVPVDPNKSLTGSYVIFDSSAGGAEGYTPFQTQDLVFYAYSSSPDWEYAYNIWLAFPGDWTINNVTVLGTPSCTGAGTWGTFSYTLVDADSVVNIAHSRYHANGGDECGAYYMVNVTAGASMGDVGVSWFWDGDGYGGTPHWPCSNDGYTPSGQSPCDEMINPLAIVPELTLEPNVYIAPPSQFTTGCPDVAQEYTLTISNYTGAEHTFALNYTVTKGTGTFSGPSEILLANEAQQDITVSITPDAGMLAPDSLVVEVEVSFDAYSATSELIEEVFVEGWMDIATEPDGGRMDNVVVTYDNKIWSITGYGSDANVRYYDREADTWTVVESSAPSFGVNYARSGAVYGSKAYIYGDATTVGFTGLWSYDMATNTWTNETPTGTAPAQTGIWAPAWVADPETGYLYMTGGAAAPGGGDLTTVYVYDPNTNAWLDPLTNFTSARAFHGAFIYFDAATTHKMLAVVGGINAAGTALSSTQCYDFTTATWNAENADMAVLPATLWGFGYAHNVLEGEHQLWAIGGIEVSDPIATSLYYDVNTNAWIAGGTFGTAVYRTQAAAFGAAVYKIGGSTGGFSPTGLANKHYICGASTYVPSIANEESFIIKPNPTNGIFTVSGTGKFAVEITDLTGRIIMTGRMVENQGNFDISSMPSGIYIIRLSNERGSSTYKAIKL